MKGFKKFLTIALAAVTGLSISTTALAEDTFDEVTATLTESDNYVCAALDETGETVYYTQEEVDALHGQIPTAIGTIHIITSDEASEIKTASVTRTGFTLTGVPTNSWDLRASSSYPCDFTIPRRSIRYSDYLFQNMNAGDEITWIVDFDQSVTNFVGALTAYTTVNGIYGQNKIFELKLSSSTSGFGSSNLRADLDDAYLSIGNNESGTVSGTSTLYND